MEVVEFSSTGAIEGAQWDELWAHSPHATVFQRRQWIEAWLETFGPQHSPPKIIAAFEGSRLVGLIPLIADGESRRWKIVGDDYSDYQSVLAWDDSDSVVSTLLDACDRLLPPGADLYLRDVPELSALELNLSRRAASVGSRIRASGLVSCPTLAIRGNPVGVAQVLAKRSLVRHERALQRLGKLSVEHLVDPREIEPFLEGLFSQHIERWQGTPHPSLFLNPLNRRFYHAATARVGCVGGVVFTVVKIDDRVVAQHFGLRSGANLFWYKPAFDVALRKSSPGEVLLKGLVQFARDSGFDELDFTRGDEGFKSRFASHVAFNRHFVWYRSGSSLAIAKAKDALRPAVRSLRSLSSRALSLRLRSSRALAGRAARPQADPESRTLGGAVIGEPLTHGAAVAGASGGSGLIGVCCLYVHGRLAWRFVSLRGPDGDLFLQAAKRYLDDARWHGLAVVRMERIPDGAPRVVAVSSQFDDYTVQAAAAGVDFAAGLSRIARAERVGPQP